LIRWLLLHAHRSRRLALRLLHSLSFPRIAQLPAVLLLWHQRKWVRNVVESGRPRRNFNNRCMWRRCRCRWLLRDANVLLLRLRLLLLLLLLRRGHRRLGRSRLWLPLLVLVPGKSGWSERVVVW
jgi:hypothetical protein